MSSFSLGPAPLTSDAGLLEQPALVMPCGGAAGLIARPDGGGVVGAARWRQARRPWWRHFGRAVLAVHERQAADEPLVFTVRRCWSLQAWREVRDAEGLGVGLLLLPRVLNRFGRQVAELGPGAGGWAFRAPDGRALARLSAAEGGVCVAFEPDVVNEPFVKMLLLAAALFAPPLFAPPGS
jgi:hypothetical protein